MCGDGGGGGGGALWYSLHFQHKGYFFLVVWEVSMSLRFKLIFFGKIWLGGY